jgi:hypothetical protein
MPIFAPLYRSLVLNVISGSSSFGRARPCQGRGGRFEPGLPLRSSSCRSGGGFFLGLCVGVSLDPYRYMIRTQNQTRPGGGIGRHAGLKILWPAMAVTVQLRSGAHIVTLNQMAAKNFLQPFFLPILFSENHV